MMFRFSLISVLFATIVAIGSVPVSLAAAPAASAGQTCDVAADTALGVQDYGDAIRLHERIVALHPDDALAHYHLGFAYGMTGQADKELAEYKKAEALGLQQWDLYVNLGRVYLERGDYQSATDVLLIATRLGPNHSEAHFNLGLAYEGQRMLPQAESEMRTALRLGSDPSEAGNTLAVILAEEGRRDEARQIWTDLAHATPTSSIARTNLVILDRLEKNARPAPLSPPTSLAAAQTRS